MPQSSIKAHMRRLFEPEAFHTGNYTKITQQCGCLFYKQKIPRKLVQYRQLFRSAPGGAVFSIRTTALGINI